MYVCGMVWVRIIACDILPGWPDPVYLRGDPCGNGYINFAALIIQAFILERYGIDMKVVVVKSSGLMGFILRKMFGIKKQTE